MPLSANPAARSALTYITVGALMDVWAGVWYWYMTSVPNGNRDGTWWYVCMGLLMSGAVLIATKPRFCIVDRVRLTGPLLNPMTWQIREAWMPGSIASSDMIRHSVTLTPKLR